MNTFSIALRLRRVVYEDAYVTVPITHAMMKSQPDGSTGIDMDAFLAEGIRIGQDRHIEWCIESSNLEAHPIQQIAPEGRKTFDALFDEHA